jgi:hypothetical protein
MWQAEIGNAKVTAANSLPGRGNLMCDFTLRSTRGTPVSPYDYRGRSSLVLFFAGPATHAVQKIRCSSLVARYLEIRDRGAEVLVILPVPRRPAWIGTGWNCPFRSCWTRTCRSTERVGAGDTQNAPVLAVYVTDPYMEVYGARRTAEEDTLPSVGELISWLVYMESECPECTRSSGPKAMDDTHKGESENDPTQTRI